MANLGNDEKTKIREEEIFRFEVQKWLASQSPKQWYTRMLEIFNSRIIVAIAIAAIGWVGNEALLRATAERKSELEVRMAELEERKTQKENYFVADRLNAEIDYRAARTKEHIEDLERHVESGAMPRLSKAVIKLLVQATGQANDDPNISLLGKYASYNMASLLSQLKSLSHPYIQKILDETVTSTTKLQRILETLNDATAKAATAAKTKTTAAKAKTAASKAASKATATKARASTTKVAASKAKADASKAEAEATTKTKYANFLKWVGSGENSQFTKIDIYVAVTAAEAATEAASKAASKAEVAEVAAVAASKAASKAASNAEVAKAASTAASKAASNAASDALVFEEHLRARSTNNSRTIILKIIEGIKKQLSNLTIVTGKSYRADLRTLTRKVDTWCSTDSALVTPAYRNPLCLPSQ